MTPAEIALGLAVLSAVCGCIVSAVRLGMTLGAKQASIQSQENASKQLTSGHNDLATRITILETEVQHLKESRK